MKLTYTQRPPSAFTLIELLFVIFIVVILAAIFLPSPNGGLRKAKRINCVNNLKQIGLAYYIWAGDHDGKLPMQIPTTNAGTMKETNAPNAWKTFQVMSNQLYTPKILICPADSERNVCATNFGEDLKNKISYFVGLDSNTNNPSTFLSGDDNFEIGSDAAKPGLFYISSNAPIGWTSQRHKRVGNILLSDGSVQMVSISGLQNLSGQTRLAINHLVIP